MSAEKGFLGEFGSAVMQIAEEKGIARDKVIGVVEAAIAAAYKKEYGRRGQNIRAIFNEKDGSVQFFLLKEVVDETTRDFSVVEAGEEEGGAVAPATEAETEGEEEERLPRFNEERDITLEDARKEKEDAQVGDIIEFPLPPHTEFGRVAAQTAKQVVIQRVREAERDAMFEEYKGREHEVVSAVVQRVEGRTVFVDLGKSIGVLFPSEQIRGEHYTVGMRLKVYILEVSQDPKGPGITVSRTHPELVRRLFELEVPEIFAGTVEIKAIAREAGSRAKVAVYTEEEGVDPIGSCVGQRGTRVQTIIDELGGEKMDIIEWDADPVQFISAALSPAKVISVQLDDEKKEAVAIVPDDQLSLAIGKRGQNVRLAVKLTGWNIDVVGASSGEKQSDSTAEQEEGSREEASAENVTEAETAADDAASTADASAEDVTEDESNATPSHEQSEQDASAADEGEGQEDAVAAEKEAEKVA